jgi:hypothetical protein
MKNLKIVYWLNYLFFIAPPRSLSIKHKADIANGELSGKSIFTVTSVEILIRISLFLLVASAMEYLLGETIYENLKFDWWFLALIICGAIHSVLYIVCAHYSMNKRFIQRLYRFGRNTLYACLCAIASMLIINALEIFQLIPSMDDADKVKVFWISNVIFFMAGTIEALIAKRLPLATMATLPPLSR